MAAVFHIINHATFKASLFMAAGIIDHETGTRDMRRINGLWRYMPWDIPSMLHEIDLISNVQDPSRKKRLGK